MIKGELKCKCCGNWFVVDADVYDRYIYEGDDYQCEKCFYAGRDNIFDYATAGYKLI